MAILQRTSLFPQMRLDVPDARAIEAFTQNDWTYFIRGFVSKKSMVISGFDITNWANIFTVPGVKLQQNNVSLIHPEATTQAMGFYVSSGTEPNYNLVLNPNTTNFVEINLKATGGARDTRAFWDPASNGGKGGEYTDTVDTVINLELDILVNVSGFSAGRIPLYRIVTDTDGKVIEIKDCRPMMFRLGTGGTSPDPDAEYNFRSLPDLAHARLETANTATSATSNNQIFQGGDKNIRSMKEWMDVVMTQLKNGFGTPYWYSNIPANGISGTYQNAALTLLTGGTWHHLGTSSKVVSSTATTVTVSEGGLFDASNSSFKIGNNTFTYTSYNSSTQKFSGVSPNPTGVAVAGAIVKQGNFGHLQLESGSVLIRFGHANSTLLAFNDIDLNTYPTLFILLSDDGSSVAYGMGEDAATPIFPKTVSATTVNSITVATGGNYNTSGGKLIARGQEFSYSAYNSGTGVFTSVSPDPTGLLSIGDQVFQGNNSGFGYYHVSASTNVPSQNEGVEKVFWIAYWDGVNTMYIRDTELIAGESADVGSDNPNQIFTYIGSSGPNDDFPIYNVNSIANGTNLTDAIETAFNIIETPIYDEVIPDTGMTGWTNGSTIYLPVNSRANNSSASYTIDSGELVVYENGVLMRPGYDYTELNSSSIQLLRDIPMGSYLRFRIANIGGAGAAAGGNAGLSLQDVYNNGNTIVASTGIPATFDGQVGEKCAWFKKDIQVDGIVDPTGIQYTPVSSNPFPLGQIGTWVDAAEEKYKFTRSDGTVLDAGGILETMGGEAQYFARTKMNNSGATIPAGAPVYIKSDGTIDLADADNEDAATFFGIAATSIPNGQSGKVIYTGCIPGILTGLGLTTGTYLWLSTTPGSMSTSPPMSLGAHLRIIGIVDGDDLILQQQHNGQLG